MKSNYQRQKPVRNPRYLAFLRRHACCACGSTKNVEAAHTGPHGIGQKASDLDAIPLCFHCHRGDQCSLHVMGPQGFQRIFGLEFRDLIKFYQAEFIRYEIRREGVK